LTLTSEKLKVFFFTDADQNFMKMGLAVYEKSQQVYNERTKQITNKFSGKKS